jgi:hypothetical protein
VFRGSLDGHLPSTIRLTALAGRAYVVHLDPSPWPEPRSHDGHGQDDPPLTSGSALFTGPAGGFRGAALALTAGGVIGGVSALAVAAANDVEPRHHVTATATLAATVLFAGAATTAAAALVSLFLTPPPRVARWSYGAPDGVLRPSPRPGPSGTNLILSPIASPSGGGLILEASW